MNVVVYIGLSRQLIGWVRNVSWSTKRKEIDKKGGRVALMEMDIPQWRPTKRKEIDRKAGELHWWKWPSVISRSTNQLPRWPYTKTKTFESTTAFIKATQIKRDESDSQSLLRVILLNHRKRTLFPIFIQLQIQKSTPLLDP